MNGAELIALERSRQIRIEGYDAKHDQSLDDHALEEAAMAYIHSSIGEKKEAIKCWPWLLPFLKPRTRVRDLVRAGALIAAAIDKIQNKGEHENNR